MASSRMEECRGRRYGVTLVDLVLTVIIVGILASVATPRFVTFLHEQQVRSAALRLKADLELAARYARSTTSSESITFNTVDHSYTFSTFKDINRSSDAYTVWLSRSPYEISIQSVSLEDETTITFNAFGIPNVSGQIVLVSAGQSKTIEIDELTGRSTILP